MAKVSQKHLILLLAVVGFWCAFKRNESTEMTTPSSPTTTSSSTEHLDKLPAVLARLPYSRSRWYAGVKSGEFPKPVRLGARAVAWKRSQIDALISSLQSA